MDAKTPLDQDCHALNKIAENIKIAILQKKVDPKHPFSTQEDYMKWMDTRLQQFDNLMEQLETMYDYYTQQNQHHAQQRWPCKCYNGKETHDKDCHYADDDDDELPEDLTMTVKAKKRKSIK